jgi:hypothetical protein
MLSINKNKFLYKIINDKAYIFCNVRKKFVFLTPEEWVRQHILEFLIKEKKYSALSIEKMIVNCPVKRRADIIVYCKSKPYILVECKAPSVSLTKKIVDKVIFYNLHLHCPYLMISNGIYHYFCRIEDNTNTIYFLKTLPNYGEY